MQVVSRDLMAGLCPGWRNCGVVPYIHHPVLGPLEMTQKMPRRIRGISRFKPLNLPAELYNPNSQFASAPLNRLASRWEPDIDGAAFAWVHGVLNHENHFGEHRVVLAAPRTVRPTAHVFKHDPRAVWNAAQQVSRQCHNSESSAGSGGRFEWTRVGLTRHRVVGG